jgi:rod shape-determining protein MreD
MNPFEEKLLPRRARGSASTKFTPLVWILAPLAAIVFQVYVPRLIESLSYLELPLLMTVYLALMRRSPIAGAATGAVIGLMQDSLSHQYLGMFGIVKTLVGYFAASVSMRFDVENSALRFLLSFFFFMFHQLFVWLLTRALLGQPMELQIPQTVILAFLNAVVAIPLFLLLDRLKSEAR